MSSQMIRQVAKKPVCFKSDCSCSLPHPIFLSNNAAVLPDLTSNLIITDDGQKHINYK